MNKRSRVGLWCAAASLLAGCGVWQFGVGPEDAAAPYDAAPGVISSCEAAKYCWDFSKIEKKADLPDWKFGKCWDVAGSANAGSVQHALYIKECPKTPTSTTEPADSDAWLPEIDCSSQKLKLETIKIRQYVNTYGAGNFAEIYQNEPLTQLQKEKIVTVDREIKTSACSNNNKLQIRLHAEIASNLVLGSWIIQRIEIVP